MRESYIDYAMSVIVSRALPDVRDGLKPVQRRILYAMYEMGLRADAKFRKCAAITGEVLGKFHPHGDAPVYDALVRMAQDFSLRYPLIKGQGNFGCFTKDTKVRLCNGKDLSFEDLIKEQKEGKRHWTFTFNPVTKKIEITEIKNPRLTRKNEKIMEVTLDNGEKIKCTLDHLFMLRDGSYRQAKDLKPGDSLMPLYIKSYLNKHPKVTPEIYERERTNNGIPRIERALNYFNNFSEILAESQKRNHKVVRTRILQEREDVYDITTEPWHNFALSAGVFVHNSIDNDPPAAQRYTEAKLSKIGEEMLKDIEKNTVDFVPNYDRTRNEPAVLPSPLPQLLLNGSLGIAVGMATDIPPHNLSEVCDALIYLVDHPDAQTEELFEFIKGPDFPSAGYIFGKKDIIQAYSQGKGPILTRGKAEIVETKKGRHQIIISELPFQVQKSAFLLQLSTLVSEKKIEGIKDIRDESDKEGMRIVIELQKGTIPQKVLNRLYKFSELQRTYHLNMLALVEGIQPRVLNLVETLNYFLLHRKEVVVRRTKYDLEKAKERAHILEGLHKCLSQIDKVIQTIKRSASREEARKNLIKRFRLTEIQANAILETKLSSLARLERKKIEDELKEMRARIKELTSILKSPKKVKGVIKKELSLLKEKFGDRRKTKVFANKPGEISIKDLIPKEETIITLTQGGYIKRINPKTYRIQNRGGKGMMGMKTVGEDIVEHFLTVNTQDNLLFFTGSGKVFRSPVYEIPEGKRTARGRGLPNFLEISPKEKVLSLIPLGEAEQARYLLMVTKNGLIKKTPISEFENVRKSGLIAISLKKGDLLCKVAKTSGKDDIILVTKKGKAIRFREKDVRPMGRPAAGVKGIGLEKGDCVIGMDVISGTKAKQYLLVITENGYGKRTSIREYRRQGRGGRGIISAKVNPKTGDLVFSKVLGEEEKDLVVISQKGQVIRLKLSQISKLSRSARGVRIMRLESSDRVASAACL